MIIITRPHIQAKVVRGLDRIIKPRDPMLLEEVSNYDTTLAY